MIVTRKHYLQDCKARSSSQLSASVAVAFLKEGEGIGFAEGTLIIKDWGSDEKFGERHDKGIHDSFRTVEAVNINRIRMEKPMIAARIINYTLKWR